jgi:hypothetical protein
VGEAGAMASRIVKYQIAAHGRKIAVVGLDTKMGNRGGFTNQAEREANDRIVADLQIRAGVADAVRKMRWWRRIAILEFVGMIALIILCMR